MNGSYTCNKLEEQVNLPPEGLFAILGLILEEAEAFGSNNARLSFHGQQIIYEFNTNDGKLARGTIDPGIREILTHFLDVARLSVGLHIPLEGGQKFLEIKKSGEGGNFDLSWMAANTPQLLAVKGKCRRRKRRAARPPVLIIEDNEGFANVLGRFLDRMNATCSFARSGDEALRNLHDVSLPIPAAIVCDIHMPGMSGLRFASAVKSDPELSSIPLIMITSDDSVEMEIQAITAGAEALVKKAEDPRVLCAHLTRLLTAGSRR